MPVTYKTSELEVRFEGRDGEVAFISIKTTKEPLGMHGQDLRLPLMLVPDLVMLLTKALQDWACELPAWALRQCLGRIKRARELL